MNPQKFLAYLTTQAMLHSELAAIYRDHAQFLGWVLSWGLEVKRGPNVVWISTENDPSVGIYAEDISPMFTNINDLIEWWKVERDSLDVQMEAMFG